MRITLISIFEENEISKVIDKDYNKVLKLQELLKKSFEPFFLEFNQLALFDYPGELIETFKISEM